MGRFYQDLFVCKVLVIGDVKVGKSSLIDKYVFDKFNEETSSTIGVDFRSVGMTYMDRKMKLMIWDTAGQERFRSIVTSYYRDADCVILCYDISDKESFNSLNNWYDTIKKNCLNDTLVFMVGTKSDRDDDREVSKIDAENFAAERNIHHCEISSKNSTKNEINEQLFHPIIKSLYERDKYVRPQDTETVVEHKEKSCCNIN